LQGVCNAKNEGFWQAFEERADVVRRLPMTGSVPLRKTRGSGSCPVCGKSVDPDYRPFCSRRCADIDLGRWLNGGYAIAGEEVASGGEDEAENHQE